MWRSSLLTRRAVLTSLCFSQVSAPTPGRGPRHSSHHATVGAALLALCKSAVIRMRGEEEPPRTGSDAKWPRLVGPCFLLPGTARAVMVAQEWHKIFLALATAP